MRYLITLFLLIGCSSPTSSAENHYDIKIYADSFRVEVLNNSKIIHVSSGFDSSIVAIPFNGGDFVVVNIFNGGDLYIEVYENDVFKYDLTRSTDLLSLQLH